MNKKIIIAIFILLVLIMIGLAINSSVSKNSRVEPNQNETIDKASGLEVLNPEDRVPELGGGETVPIIGAQEIYDAGAPKDIVDPIISELNAYALKQQPKPSKISIYKGSVKQVFASDSPLTTVTFDILVSDKEKLSVSADYLTTNFIDTLVIKDQSGGVVYNYTISGD